MIELLKPYYLSIVKWGGIALAALLVVFKIRQSGKDAVVAKDMQDTLEGVKKRDEIENTVSAADIVERKRLRDKWER